MLFSKKYDFEKIKKIYDKSISDYSKIKAKQFKNTPEELNIFFNSKQYKHSMLIIKRGIDSMKKGINKTYYQYVSATNGNYSRRKGGNIYSQVKSSIYDLKELMDKEDAKLSWSFLKVYTDIFNILENPDWKKAFAIAFNKCAMTNDNSIAFSFKSTYIALVIALESIVPMVLEFQHLLYSGISKEETLIKIMNSRISVMKNVVEPAIELICICNMTSDPEKTILSMIRDESSTNVSKESYSYSTEGLVDAFRSIKNVFYQNKQFTTVGKWVIWSIIAVISTYVILNIIPATRYLIYYFNTRKVDKEKEIEISAEILANNIIKLREKSSSTTDQQEKLRLQNVISKQLEMYEKLIQSINKNYDDGYRADADVMYAMEEDDKEINPNGDKEADTLIKGDISETKSKEVNFNSPTNLDGNDDSPIFDMDI